jgi:hypothetical protein
VTAYSVYFQVSSTSEGLHIGFLLGKSEETDHWEELDVGGRVILKWILEK